jgi:hypothetical protein
VELFFSFSVSRISGDDPILEAGMRVCHFAGSTRLTVLGGVALVLFFPLLLAGQDKAGQAKKSSKKGVGFTLSQDVTEQDLGVPIYPGARRYKDESDSSSAVQMGLGSGSSAFKLVVLKLETDDSPAKVAAFYRTALAKYGRVLDCTKPPAKTEKPAASADELSCDEDDAAGTGFTLKAGTKEKQHVVAVKPAGSRTHFALVYVEAPADSKKD